MYCRYQLSYGDLEEMMRERGLSVYHVTICRWVQRYAPEINKRMRPHLKLSGAPDDAHANNKSPPGVTEKDSVSPKRRSRVRL